MSIAARFGVEETTIAVRVGVTVFKDGRGSRGRWQAHRNGTSVRPTWFRTSGHTSKTDAKAEIGRMVLAAIERMEDTPVLVVGGNADYANCLHLITPSATGYLVTVIRAGKHTTSWTTGGEMADVLAQVREHVGDGHTVIYC